MKVIGWPVGVNQRIVDESSYKIGENGYIEDKDSNGYEEGRATALAVPDQYTVVMDFDWNGIGNDYQYPVDEEGYTEYDRFVRWFKYKQKRSNPFWFPCISKHPVDNLQSKDKADMCLYKITSSLSPQKSGLSMRVQMTWKEVYSGLIEVPNKVVSIDHINAKNGELELVFNGLPDELPIYTDLFISYTTEADVVVPVTIKRIYQERRSVMCSFDKITTPGTYNFTVTSTKFAVDNPNAVLLIQG